MAVGEVNAEITVRATRQLLFEEDLEETKAKAEMKTQAEFVAINDAATARLSPAPGSKVGTSDGLGTQRWGTFFFLFFFLFFFSSFSPPSSFDVTAYAIFTFTHYRERGVVERREETERKRERVRHT